MIARKSLLIFEFNILSALLGCISMFFVVRYMGIYVWGIVGFGVAYVTIFSCIGDFGFDMAHVKRVSEGKDLATCIGTFARIKIALTIIMALFILGSICVWKYVLGRGFESPQHELFLYVMMFYMMLLILSNFFQRTFSARMETAKFQFPIFIETLSRVIAIIIVVIFDLGVLALASAYIVGALVMLFTTILLFRGYPIGSYNKDYFKSYLQFALPIFFVAATTTIGLNIDKVMLQLFWSSVEVGYYFGVQKITWFVIALSGGVCLLLFPTLSGYHSQNKIPEIASLTQKAARYISLTIFPIITFIIALAPEILRIFSSELLPAVSVLRVLAVYALLTAIRRPFASQFGAINRPKLGAKITLIISLLNIGLNIIFIPSSLFGIKLLGLRALGAALTTTISTIVGIALTIILVRKLTGTTIYSKTSLHLFSACFTGLLLYALARIIILSRISLLLPAALLCLGTYLLILYCLGEFTKEDLLFFGDTLNPRKLLGYMKEELLRKKKI